MICDGDNDVISGDGVDNDVMCTGDGDLRGGGDCGLCDGGDVRMGGGDLRGDGDDMCTGDVLRVSCNGLDEGVADCRSVAVI